LLVGAASRIINNEVGAYVQAATHRRQARSIRDDLEANALLLSRGGESVLLVSCDLAGLEPEVAARLRRAMAGRTGLGARNIIISCTHTHSGPVLIPSNYRSAVDTAYIERLEGRLVELAAEAEESLTPARLGWGRGEARVGYNRRCCWADGTHTMHGDTTREDFTGLEGPEDPQHVALFALDEDDRPLAVLYNNTTHPTTFYGAEFYSADFPGQVRAELRAVLGPVAVLFLNGAFGDIQKDSMVAPGVRREGREQKLARLTHLLAGETLRLMMESEVHDAPVLRHAHEDLCVAVRLPDSAAVAEARRLLSRVDEGEEVPAWDVLFAHGTALLEDRFGAKKADTLPVHAVRVGELALVTQPCELYCQFGLDIKRRSPAPITAVCGPADGYCGYCPTTAGVLGGGYSGTPIYWCRLEQEAGYRIVDAAARFLCRLWRE
jgi:hypothetical protein